MHLVEGVREGERVREGGREGGMASRRPVVQLQAIPAAKNTYTCSNHNQTYVNFAFHASKVVDG